jgi:hypothetical protein
LSKIGDSNLLSDTPIENLTLKPEMNEWKLKIFSDYAKFHDSK